MDCKTILSSIDSIVRFMVYVMTHVKPCRLYMISWDSTKMLLENQNQNSLRNSFFYLKIDLYAFPYWTPFIKKFLWNSTKYFLYLLRFPTYKEGVKTGPTPKISILIDLMSSWDSKWSCCLHLSTRVDLALMVSEKVAKGDKKGRTPNRILFSILWPICVHFSPLEFLRKTTFWKLPHRFVVAFIVSVIWEDLKSYMI